MNLTLLRGWLVGARSASSLGRDMDRRDFLKSTGTLIAAATVSSGLPAGAESTLVPKAKSRSVLPINRNWRYSAKASEAARARVFDDSKFERVTVPHTTFVCRGTASTKRHTSLFLCIAGGCGFRPRRAANAFLWTLKE